MEKSNRRFVHRFVSYFVLLFTLVVATVATYFIWQIVTRQAEAEFQNQTLITQTVIERRVTSYVDMLYGVSGLFAASESVERSEFKTYLQALNVSENYPGISGISFTKYVPAVDKANYEASIQSEGYPEFAVKPTGERSDYYVITYTEPFNPTGGAFGFDLSTSPERLTAIQRARDTGMPAASQPVSLLNSTEVGFIIFMPIYKNGQPTDTIEQRRENFIGVINAVISMDKMFQPWLEVLANKQMDILIYDEDNNAEHTLFQTTLVSSQSGKISTQLRTLDIGGRIWTIQYTGDRYYRVSATDAALYISVVVLSYIFSIFSFILARFTTINQAHANSLAHEIIIKKRLHKKI